jgi:hypothetical protein
MSLTKFYVSSAKLEILLLAETPRFAALCAMDLHGTLAGLGAYIYVSEFGFETNRTGSASAFEATELWNELLTEIGEKEDG